MHPFCEMHLGAGETNDGKAIEIREVTGGKRGEDGRSARGTMCGARNYDTAFYIAGLGQHRLLGMRVITYTTYSKVQNSELFDAMGHQRQSLVSSLGFTNIDVETPRPKALCPIKIDEFIHFFRKTTARSIFFYPYRTFPTPLRVPPVLPPPQDKPSRRRVSLPLRPPKTGGTWTEVPAKNTQLRLS